jgi:micrococcal nuclease
MKYILVIFVSMITTAQAEISLRQYNGQYCYDGDTCYITMNGMKKKIRLLELDTPEISKPKCNAELEIGVKARDYLNDLIANASTIEFKTEYLEDYFGRVLSYLIIDGEDVSSKIIENQLGVVYDRNQKYDWCQDLNVNETINYTE